MVESVVVRGEGKARRDAATVGTDNVIGSRQTSAPSSDTMLLAHRLGHYNPISPRPNRPSRRSSLPLGPLLIFPAFVMLPPPRSAR